MRIIAGKYRSRVLRSLKGQALRPTSDRLRETLFNILGPTVVGATFVDLYAGTGAVGIEALSRGARAAIFVELHAPAAIFLIRRNLDSLEIGRMKRQILGTKGCFARTAKAGGAPRACPVHFSRSAILAAVAEEYENVLECV